MGGAEWINDEIGLAIDTPGGLFMLQILNHCHVIKCDGNYLK